MCGGAERIFSDCQVKVQCGISGQTKGGQIGVVAAQGVGGTDLSIGKTIVKATVVMIISKIVIAEA